MLLKMIGIDFTIASLNQREIFSFSRSQSVAAMQFIVQNFSVNGCVIVSTCNRTEIWISEEDSTTDLEKVILNLKNISVNSFKGLFVQRENIEAIRHLFETTCGLKSQIRGEDQILTQIKNSIELTRESSTSDEILEKLFQLAVTAAKSVKTKVKLSSFDVSVATTALQKIKEVYPNLKGIKCLIIGNGEMGRTMAAKLCECGADVVVTLRKYKNGESFVPQGCKAIDYDKRHDEIKHANLIVSATLSTHYTIKLDDMITLLPPDGSLKLFVDLAVPRDIDPEIAELKNIKLLDMDCLGAYNDLESNDPELIKANEIINEYINEFLKWQKLRILLPIINNIAFTTSKKIQYHMQNVLNNFDFNENQKDTLEHELLDISKKAVSGLLFGVKDSIDDDLWEECFESLSKSIR
jgi:glutamyl-tRNA reductase